MNVLIIEDEPLAQDELVRIIRKRFPQMRIVASLCSVKESIQWLGHNGVDLIFMDVHLADGICFDIFEHVCLRTPVIFTTAYDQYAIQAFKVNGIGYLLKPIVEEDLVNTVAKLEYTQIAVDGLLEHLKMNSGFKNRIVVKTGDRFASLSIEDIAYFYAEEGMTFAVSHQGKRHSVDYTVERLEALLNPKDFFRITRGCIASIHSIEKVTRHFNSRLKVLLKPDYCGELLVSRIRVPDFIRWLDGE